MSPEPAEDVAGGDAADGPGACGDLSPSEVRSLLQTDFWVRIEGGGATGSTNDDARELALAGAPEGTAVLASSQSTGRGRFGRAWESPGGGVYLSAVLRPPLDEQGLGPLPLVIGLGVAFGLERLGVAPMLKWPNDVLLGGDKVAGVLVESRFAGGSRPEPRRADAADSSTAWAIAGVGLNVFRVSGESAAPGAGFLCDELPHVTCMAVAAAALDGIAIAYRRHLAHGSAVLREDYVPRSATLGHDVFVSDAGGGTVARGCATDVDDLGRLVVDSADGPVAVTAGEVTLRATSGRA